MTSSSSSANALRRDLVRYWYGRLGPVGDRILWRLDPCEAFRQEARLAGHPEAARMSDAEIRKMAVDVADALRRVSVESRRVADAFRRLVTRTRPPPRIGPERQLAAGKEAPDEER